MVAEDSRMSVAGYARGMVRADLDFRSKTRELYERTIKHHLDATVLGKMDIPIREGGGPLSGWWAGLKDTNTGKAAGPRVRRNAQQLLARTFNRAVLVGDIEVSPLKRAPEIRRPKARRRDNVLTVDQLEALAAAAARADGGRYARDPMVCERDRLIVLVRVRRASGW
jgi:hypothetical protein